MLRRFVASFLLPVVTTISACTMRHSAVWLDASKVEDLHFWVADNREHRGPI
jgi:hypothetical protein